MTQEAMKLALEALKWSKPHEDAIISHSEAITAIEEALAQLEQEPVAWQFFEGGKWHNGMEVNDHRKHTEAAGVPVRDLYTHSPQRTWVGLTDEEIDSINYTSAHMLAREVEAKLKERNQ